MQNDLHDHIECRITLARTSAAGFVVSAGNEGRGAFGLGYVAGGCG